MLSPELALELVLILESVFVLNISFDLERFLLFIYLPFYGFSSAL